MPIKPVNKMRLFNYVIEGAASDKADIKVAMEKIKEKVAKIIAAMRAGDITTAAKAVVEYTYLWGAPFTTELATAMLVIKSKEFIDSWKIELAAQQEIFNKLHPTTPPTPKAPVAHKDSPAPKPPPVPAHVGSQKPVGPEGSHT